MAPHTHTAAAVKKGLPGTQLQALHIHQHSHWEVHFSSHCCLHYWIHLCGLLQCVPWAKAQGSISILESDEVSHFMCVQRPEVSRNACFMSSLFMFSVAVFSKLVFLVLNLQLVKGGKNDHTWAIHHRIRSELATQETSQLQLSVNRKSGNLQSTLKHMGSKLEQHLCNFSRRTCCFSGTD